MNRSRYILNYGNFLSTCCRREGSSYTPYDPKQAKELQTLSKQSLSARVRNVLTSMTKKKFKYGARKNIPLNWNYPNEKFLDNYDPSYSLEEAIKDAKPILNTNIKKTKDMIKNYFTIDNDLIDDTIGPLQNQVRIEFDFKSDEAMKRWQTGCDRDWDEGFSHVNLKRTSFNTALFSGQLDSRLIKNGKIERAGWATMKTIDIGPFRRKNYLWYWNHYSHVLIKCRGDGRSYKVMLYTPGYVDVSWGDTWSYHLHTHGGPYWQYERIPFSRFIHTVGGRIQDRQHEVMPFEISNISIVMMDRLDGPFQLEIDFIGVVQDYRHNEKFAYETYNIPLYNTDVL